MEPRYTEQIAFFWVTDWQRSMDFYTQVLGFNPTFEDEGWAELKVPGVTNGYLALNQWGKDSSPPINEFVTLRVDDLEAFKSHLHEHNVKLKEGEYEFPEHGMRMIKFFDPDKNVLSISQVMRD